MPCFDFYIVTCSYSSRLFLHALGTWRNKCEANKEKMEQLPSFVSRPYSNICRLPYALTWGKVTNLLLIVQATSMLG